MTGGTVVDNADRPQTLDEMEMKYWTLLQMNPDGKKMRRVRLKWLLAVQKVQVKMRLN